MAMFGSGWLGWGLGVVHAFTLPVVILFDIVIILLLGYSIYFVWEGRFLRQKHSSSSSSVTQSTNRKFIVVLVPEFTAIVIVAAIAHALHRPDLGTVSIAIVVGLHFLPLAKIFRVPVYYAHGTAMTLWCTLCLILFSSNALVASTTIGTGVLLCATSAFVLFRAREIVRSLAAIP